MIEKHPKSKYRAVLTALAADCRAFPGFGGESKGLTAIAESLGCNRNTMQLLNAFAQDAEDGR